MKLITALATPFKNNEIDLSSYKKLLKIQAKFADELLCCGTTGECAMLSEKEKRLLTENAKEIGLPVWTGIEGATQNAVADAKIAKECGADGVLVTPPSFFKCTEQGFEEHVKRLRDVGLKVMLYNAPSRCGYELWENAVKRLSCDDVCLKDAGGDIRYARKIAKHTTLFCGNDDKVQEYTQIDNFGGLVSVVSNAFPCLTKDVLHSYANKTQLKAFSNAAKVAFCRLNPIPIKYVLFKAGIFDSFEVRLPLTAASQATQKKIDTFWATYSQEILI